MYSAAMLKVKAVKVTESHLGEDSSILNYLIVYMKSNGPEHVLSF